MTFPHIFNISGKEVPLTISDMSESFFFFSNQSSFFLRVHEIMYLSFDSILDLMRYMRNVISSLNLQDTLHEYVF
jgi:hypothetical protein